MRHGGRWTTHAFVLATFLATGLGTGAPASGDDVPVLADDRLGTRTAPLLLLTRPDVQADLKLTPEQVASAAGVPTAAEAVCLLLEHLAADGRARSSGAGDPGQMRFSRV